MIFDQLCKQADDIPYSEEPDQSGNICTMFHEAAPTLKTY